MGMTKIILSIFFTEVRQMILLIRNVFLKALAGPNGEKLFYKKLESCCPFPTKQSEIGAGLLDVYQVNWVGCKRPLLLYFNIYEKGKLYIPMGLTAKKD